MKHWRQAATLILTAGKGAKIRHAAQKVVPDYNILMLKRSSRSSFFPAASVFPGGTKSKTDFAEDWENLFRNRGDLTEITNRLSKCARPPMLEESLGGLPADVGFRICAIRETFEEVGVLLCKDTKSEHSGSLVLSDSSENSLSKWRHLVQENDEKFLDMCIDLKLVPDICALYDWSNWLTPIYIPEMHGRPGKRFDTVFYIAFLNQQPHTTQDNMEISSAQWYDSHEIMSRHEEKVAWLAPPQLYELKRMSHFTEFQQLKQHARHRESLGCEQWLPVRISCQDGVIAVLPGDDLYPEDPDLYEERPMPESKNTVSELRKTSRNIHRTEILGDIHGTPDMSVIGNVKSQFGQALIAVHDDSFK